MHSTRNICCYERDVNVKCKGCVVLYIYDVTSAPILPQFICVYLKM
jgi:hypothetical protein